jgi:hypothetical protein
MDRYSIAKNEKPKTPELIRVQTFGFDSEPCTVSKFYHKEVFTMPLEGAPRVGVVFDDPKKIFTAGDTHFHGRHYFLCKSVDGRDSICCQQLKRTKRFACVLVEYDNESIKRVVPWVFGTRVYEQMKAINAQGGGRGIISRDFILRRSSEPYNPWTLFALPDNSLWQTAPFRDTVLTYAQLFLRNMKRYIGEDLTPAQIKTLFETEPITPGGDSPRYGRAQPQPRLRDRLEENDARLRLNQVIRDWTVPYPAARTDADRQIDLDDLLREL